MTVVPFQDECPAVLYQIGTKSYAALAKSEEKVTNSCHPADFQLLARDLLLVMSGGYVVPGYRVA